MDKANLRKVAFWTLVFWVIIWAMAPWLDRPVVQPIRNAWVLTGQGLASFPMWGYSLLLLGLGSVSAVVVLQSFIGALATAVLVVRLNCLVPQLKVVTTSLFLLSIPWLSFMAYAYQMPISSAFMIFALLTMEIAISTGSLKWGMAAGVLFGVGQNFRSELLLLPVGAFIVIAVMRSIHRLECMSMRPLVLCVVLAFLTQIPWALNCLLHEGRFSLTESNFGHVAFIGLGELPSNPWGIEPSDEFAQRTITQGGLTCSSLSFQGSDFLKLKFIESVSQHPASYAKCIAKRLWGTIYYPFGYVAPIGARAGKWHEGTKGAETADVGSVSPLPSPIVASPEHSSPFRVAVVPRFFYWIGKRGLVVTVSLLGLLGCLLATGKAPFSIRQPIILLLGVAIVYRFGMNVMLYECGKYMTGVYLCYLPFTANTLSAVFQRRVWRECANHWRGE